MVTRRFQPSCVFISTFLKTLLLLLLLLPPLRSGGCHPFQHPDNGATGGAPSISQVLSLGALAHTLALATAHSIDAIEKTTLAVEAFVQHYGGIETLKGLPGGRADRLVDQLSRDLETVCQCAPKWTVGCDTNVKL